MRLIDKYQPEKLHDIVGQNQALGQLVGWVDKPGGKGLLAYGPPGVGKTAAAHALAKERGLELIEMNASDFRKKEQIRERLLNAAIQGSLFGKGKLILVDEVDGLAGRSDMGATQAIAELIKNSRYPVFLTCNDNWSRAVRGIKSYVREVKFAQPRTDTLANFLTQVCKKEGLDIKREAILQLATQRDVRSALLDLEALSATPGAGLEELEGLGLRNRDKSIFEALRDVFKAKSSEHARKATEGLNMDVRDFMAWLDENMAREYEGEDLFRGFDALSRADVFMGRIRRRQDWSLLKYTYDLSTVGVALAKRKAKYGFTPYKPSKYLKALSYSRSSRATMGNLLKKLAKKTHTSSKVAYDYLPVLKGMVEAGTPPFEMSDSEIKVLDKMVG